MVIRVPGTSGRNSKSTLAETLSNITHVQAFDLRKLKAEKCARFSLFDFNVRKMKAESRW